MENNFTFTHMGDLHLGSYQGKMEQGGINSRFLDFVKTFNEAIDYSIDKQIKFCLINGDVFKTKEPQPSELDAFAAGIKRLIDKNIKVIVVPGNHDLFLSEKLKHNLSIFKTLKLPNIFILDSPQILTVGDGNWKIQIQSMPYQHRNILKKKNHEEVSEYIEKNIEELYKTRDTKLPIIFAGHFSIRDIEYGTEQRTINKFSEPIISKSVFLNKDYLYVAMGHIHKYQKFMENPPAYYCGSINRIDFNESQEEKGFIHVEVNEKKVTPTFIRVNARKFLDLDFDLTKEENPEVTLLKILESKKDELKDSIIKLTVSLSETNKNYYIVKHITDFLNKYCYHIQGSCSPHIIEAKDSKVSSGYSEYMNPFEALKLYSDKNEKICNKNDFLKLGQEIINKVLLSNK